MQHPRNDHVESAAAAMEAEQYVDGKVVVTQGYQSDELDSCWNRFKHGIRSIWATRHTEDAKEDKELYIKTTLRELIIYILFLIVLMIITFSMTSGTMYYFTKIISDLFLETKFTDNSNNFIGSTNVVEYWKFLNGPLLSGLFWDRWYNSKAVTQSEKNFIYYENKLLGVARIRQVKVKSDSCTIADDFKDEIKDCYASYSLSAEDKEPFGTDKPGLNMTLSAWNYTTGDKIRGDTNEYKGYISTYGVGGYYVDLTRDLDSSLQIVQELFTNLWITRGTRAAFVDFTVYNANINLFCVVKIAAEFPATGGMIPSFQFRTVKLIRYVSSIDYFVMACEVIFLLFIGYYIIEEIIEIKKHRLRYFHSLWNWFDLIVIVISIVCAIFNIYRTLKVQEKLDQLLRDENRYPEFDFLSYWEGWFNYAIAITVFTAWIKIFKYISFNKTMTQLSSTLGRCAKDLLGFAVMFFIIFFAFAQLGYLIFGTQVRDFRQFQHSIYTLFRIILGDFDFHQLESAHPVLGPLFFILYVFFVFFVLINMFLAIINDTYSEVKSELANKQSEIEMGDYLRQRAKNLVERLNLGVAGGGSSTNVNGGGASHAHQKKMLGDIKDTLDVAADQNVEFDEWREELKGRGYNEAAIESVFARYDTDGNRMLDGDEKERLRSELDEQRRQLNSGGGGGTDRSGDGNNGAAGGGGSLENSVSSGEFSNLQRRVERLETSISNIVTKIDGVLVNLEQLELEKVKRREKLGRVLERIGPNQVNQADMSSSRGPPESAHELDVQSVDRVMREEMYDDEANE